MYRVILIAFMIIVSYLVYYISKLAYEFWMMRFSKSNPPQLSVQVVTTIKKCKSAFSTLVEDCHELGVLGLDCEWVTETKEGKSVQKPVSLLQLASINNNCCLFRLNRLGHIPPDIRKLLENDKIYKLGVNCNHDCKLIEKDYGVKIKSYLDVRHLYPNETSLASLAKNILNIHLKKDISVKCTNWNQRKLTNDQIVYAAKDAWIAVEIFKAWLEDYPSTYRTVADLGLGKYIDVPFIVKKKDNKNVKSNKEKTSSKKLPAKFARKSPLYHNCWMYAPDGELLCSCDKRKAEWYVTKGLAEVYKEEPFSIKLLFEPNARFSDELEGEFYKQVKQNSCVVCNSQQLCMRHYVVPKEYRKHFPTNMKSHQSHDIVLTCIDCHSKAQVHMRNLKEELAEICNAPICVPPSLEKKQLQKVKNICKTLLNSGQNIPKKRREELEQIIKDYTGLPNIDDKVLEEITNKTESEKENLGSHGKKVVEYYLANNELRQFEELWRRAFLDNMKPKFLPRAWSVNHNPNYKNKLKQD